MIRATDASLWHHAPVHLFVPNSVYMVTAGIHRKDHLFGDADRLRLMQGVLFTVMDRRRWLLEAWAIFSNHYHWIAQSPASDGDVGGLVRELHSKSAVALNRIDGSPGRKVWYQYWDTCLTIETSYFARLNYVMQNPARHGIVRKSELYPFCSANWFAQKAPSALQRKLASYGSDRVNVGDEFEPLWEEAAPSKLRFDAQG
jgi:putative transposase